MPGLNCLFFFMESPDGSWPLSFASFSFPFPPITFFSFPFSFNLGTLPHLPNFVFLIYLFLLIYSITLTIFTGCCNISLDNYNCKLKSSKRCSIKKFWMTLHPHNILMSCSHIIPLFDFHQPHPFQLTMLSNDHTQSHGCF